MPEIVSNESRQPVGAVEVEIVELGVRLDGRELLQDGNDDEALGIDMVHASQMKAALVQFIDGPNRRI